MTGDARDFPTASTVAIARQNDQFRRGMIAGMPEGMKGRMVFTHAIAAQGRSFETACILAVAQDGNFTESNDPFGERDFGTLDVMDRRIWWKLDLYDNDYSFGSPDGADLAVTARVLTILFPSDY
ncbi:DUF3768 domain-containing protein [Paracoccus broussonetiae]|uniref:DUF3768 domain-containing protein n=1 Tax=Paracoccus broussonetiae TaxID=3075834 RepID=UPI002889F882|nr:DUF3768 domain-containing protein [Paracoccus sp. CPCC 101403]